MKENFDKKEYKQLKKHAKYYGVVVKSFPTSSVWLSNKPHNGVSFAVGTLNAGPFVGRKMVDVAVSYCSIEDAFDKKVGKYNVLKNMFQSGEYIQLPLYNEFISNKDELFEELYDRFV